MTKDPGAAVLVRQTQASDLAAVVSLSDKVYPGNPWAAWVLRSQLEAFPMGQLVAEQVSDGRILGMAASLIITWDDYTMQHTYDEVTGQGLFDTHDPRGSTLYGAEVMVDPEARGRGVGKKLYTARRELCRALSLRRIRAGARLRGYHKHADRLTPEQYAIEVVNRRLTDPTLSFQLRQGFRLLAVVTHYLPDDPESLGAAAIIEWINHRVARPSDWRGRDPRFGRRRLHRQHEGAD